MTIDPSPWQACDHARTYGSWRSQLMHVSVQKFTRTTWPRNSAGTRGPEIRHPGAPPRAGDGSKVRPRARPAERGHVQPFEHGQLTERPESLAQLGGVQLRLLPGGE